MLNLPVRIGAIPIAILSISSMFSHGQSIVPGGSNWGDSYSVDGKCYCASSYDHGIGEYTVSTPAGTKTVIEVCEAIGAGPGIGSNPIYNTVQCGHDPAHDDKGNFLYTDGVDRYVADEIECPGRVDIGPEGCDDIGPMWDLSVFDSRSEHVFPGTIEAEDYSEENGTVIQSTEDENGGLAIGHIEEGDFLSFDIDVDVAGTYQLSFRVASPRSYAEMTMSFAGSASETIGIPNTGGWEEWTTIDEEFDLSAGAQTLHLDFGGGSGGLMNINWIEANLSGGETELDSINWNLSSNTNESDVHNAIDDDYGTRWTSEKKQENGIIFTIDFNETLSFDRIILDSTNSPNDQPRTYSIQVSNDGNNWGSAITTGSGDPSGMTVINFSDQTARFVRITQTGSTTYNWWSIHELSIFANSNEL